MWVLVLFGILGPPISLVVGWIAASRGLFTPKWRAWIGVVCLTAVTLQAAAYLFALFHLHEISGIAESVNFWLWWSWLNSRISLCIVACALLGKGLTRWTSISCTSSLFVFSVYVDMLR
jgi:hypothetical protein